MWPYCMECSVHTIGLLSVTSWTYDIIYLGIEKKNKAWHTIRHILSQYLCHKEGVSVGVNFDMHITFFSFYNNNRERWVLDGIIYMKFHLVRFSVVDPLVKREHLAYMQITLHGIDKVWFLLSILSTLPLVLFSECYSNLFWIGHSENSKESASQI